jgi:hypothetical protein
MPDANFLDYILQQQKVVLAVCRLTLKLIWPVNLASCQD